MDLRAPQGRLFRSVQATHGMLAGMCGKCCAGSVAIARPPHLVRARRVGRPAPRREPCPAASGRAQVWCGHPFRRSGRCAIAMARTLPRPCWHAAIPSCFCKPSIRKPVSGRARPSASARWNCALPPTHCRLAAKCRARPSPPSASSAPPCSKANCGSLRIRAIYCFPMACRSRASA